MDVPSTSPTPTVDLTEPSPEQERQLRKQDRLSVWLQLGSVLGMLLAYAALYVPCYGRILAVVWMCALFVAGFGTGLF